MSEEGYDLVFSFRDQSPSFAHGFACGRIWERMKSRSAPFTETAMDELREDVIAMATACGWREQITPIGEGWIQVEFTREHR